MRIEDAKSFIDDFNNEYFELRKGLYSEKISDKEHDLNLKKYLEQHALHFTPYLSSKLSIRHLDKKGDWLKRQLSRIFIHKCFFIEHRENIKWGKRIHTDNNSAFFCYMGGRTSNTKNNYSDIKVLGQKDEMLKVVTTIPLNHKKFHETGEISWKNKENSSLVQDKNVVLNNGWGKVIDLVKIEPPIGFQPHLDHYNNVGL